jgi:hypothetical protein
MSHFIPLQLILPVRIVMPSRSDTLPTQPLQHLPFIRMRIEPPFNSRKHLHLHGVIPIEEGRMTEDGHNVVYCGVGVDGGIGPRGDHLLDCMADDDNGDVAGGLIEIAGKVI